MKALYNGQRKNKPLLQEDFPPALERLAADAEAKSTELEQKVLIFTRMRLAELSQTVVKQLLRSC